MEVSRIREGIRDALPRGTHDFGIFCSVLWRKIVCRYCIPGDAVVPPILMGVDTV